MPNGRDIQVTDENKKDYVRLYVNYRFKRGIEEQFKALQKGFNELVPHHLLQPFEEKELEVSFLLVETVKSSTNLRSITIHSL